MTEGLARGPVIEIVIVEDKDVIFLCSRSVVIASRHLFVFCFCTRMSSIRRIGEFLFILFASLPYVLYFVISQKVISESKKKYSVKQTSKIRAQYVKCCYCDVTEVLQRIMAYHVAPLII